MLRASLLAGLALLIGGLAGLAAATALKRSRPEPVAWCANFKRLDVEPFGSGRYRLEWRSDFLGGPCRYAKHEADV
jgi:hypothetical protein